ncbi:hypothetical protein C1H46_015038 [Malus baccata]|uniref:Uncharacterized protein n=1 Tax=Malus baccata TaxID=106549 RepID=A0A540MKT5_MALBA|nr:hypothetical protein C1H46_015038 [Malus baccata]
MRASQYLAGSIIAEPILDVVELNGGVSGEPNTVVPRAFRRADLDVPVFPVCHPDNVAASYHLHDFGVDYSSAR